MTNNLIIKAIHYFGNQRARYWFLDQSPHEFTGKNIGFKKVQTIFTYMFDHQSRINKDVSKDLNQKLESVEDYQVIP